MKSKKISHNKAQNTQNMFSFFQCIIGNLQKPLCSLCLCGKKNKIDEKNNLENGLPTEEFFQMNLFNGWMRDIRKPLKKFSKKRDTYELFQGRKNKKIVRFR